MTNQTTTQQTKVCNKCGRELPVSEFNKCSGSKDGLQWYCRDCSRTANQQSYEKKKSATANTAVLRVSAGPSLKNFEGGNP